MLPNAVVGAEEPSSICHCCDEIEANSLPGLFVWLDFFGLFFGEWAGCLVCLFQGFC